MVWLAHRGREVSRPYVYRMANTRMVWLAHRIREVSRIYVYRMTHARMACTGCTSGWLFGRARGYRGYTCMYLFVDAILYYCRMSTEIRFAGKYRIPSARLAKYDYGSNGLYFITICTQNREPYFGTIDPAEGQLIPTVLGQRALDCWHAIPTFAPFVELDAFVLMPDHLHGVLGIQKPIEEQTDWQPGQFGPQSRNLASILRGFKSAVTQYARVEQIPFGWQTRFYDRVVRNAYELERIRQYIENNPIRWLAKHAP